MPETDSPSACDEVIEQESYDWLNRLLAGPPSEADAAELAAWRAQSPAHEEAFVDAVAFQRGLRRAVAAERVEADLAAYAPRRRPILPAALTALAVAAARWFAMRRRTPRP